MNISTPITATTNFWNLPQYCPEMPIGEDDASLAEHQSWLRLQHRRSIRDIDGIKTRMNITFYMRIKMIMANSLINDIIKEFPLIKEYNQVIYNIYIYIYIYIFIRIN